jgi:hypothetical protein
VVGLEVKHRNPQEYMFMCDHQNTDINHGTKVDSPSRWSNVIPICIYNQNCIHREGRRRLYLRRVGLHIGFFHVLSENMITYKTVIVPFVLYWLITWSSYH